MKQKFQQWLSDKCFHLVHGHNLVYNTCWEDPRLDRVALEIKPTDNVLVITSAGCNAVGSPGLALALLTLVRRRRRKNA